jgi:hypothetical protein
MDFDSFTLTEYAWFKLNKYSPLGINQQEFLELLSKHSATVVEDLKELNTTIYRLNYGCFIKDYLTIKEVRQYLQAFEDFKNYYIYIDYLSSYGSLWPYVLIDEIDLKYIQTDIVNIYVEQPTKKILDIVLGNLAPNNNLFRHSPMATKVLRMDLLTKSKNINRIYVQRNRVDLNEDIPY